jgi:hypothetical protein
MIALSSHTSHALQPLDVHCFKPFKTTFKKERNNAILRNNHCELNKIAFVNWVKKVLNTSLSQKMLKVSSYTHMDEKTRPDEIYIIIIIHISNEDNDNFNATIYDIDQ